MSAEEYKALIVRLKKKEVFVPCLRPAASFWRDDSRAPVGRHTIRQLKKYSIRGKMAAAAEDQALADIMNLLEAEPNGGGV